MIRASKGEKGIVEPTFVYLPGIEGGDAIVKQTGVDFFSVPIELGVRYILHFKIFHWFVQKLTEIQPSGAEKAIDVLGSVTEKEKKLLEACYKGLKGNIEKGVEFVKNPPPK